jgi:hypothetical protein
MIDALCLGITDFCEIIHKFWIVLFFEGSMKRKNQACLRGTFFHL